MILPPQLLVAHISLLALDPCTRTHWVRKISLVTILRPSCALNRSGISRGMQKKHKKINKKHIYKNTSTHTHTITRILCADHSTATHNTCPLNLLTQNLFRSPKRAACFLILSSTLSALADQTCQSPSQSTTISNIAQNESIHVSVRLCGCPRALHNYLLLYVTININKKKIDTTPGQKTIHTKKKKRKHKKTQK